MNKALLSRSVRLSPIFLALSLNAAANPTGASVVNGAVSMQGLGTGAVTVTNSPGSIINWQGFSIGANEATRFNQQSASSAVLNRVVGANVSTILGTLTSNGKVFLVNPNGVVFGAGSSIDTAAFTATTGNMTNADFLAGNHDWSGQGSFLSVTGGTMSLQGSVSANAIELSGAIGSANLTVATTGSMNWNVTTPSSGTAIPGGVSLCLLSSSGCGSSLPSPNVTVIAADPLPSIISTGNNPVVQTGGNVSIGGGTISVPRSTSLPSVPVSSSSGGITVGPSRVVQGAATVTSPSLIATNAAGSGAITLAASNFAPGSASVTTLAAGTTGGNTVSIVTASASPVTSSAVLNTTAAAPAAVTANISLQKREPAF